MIKIFVLIALFFGNLFAANACEQFQEEIQNKAKATKLFIELAQ